MRQFDKSEYEQPQKKRFIKAAMGYNRAEVDQFLRDFSQNPLPSEQIKTQKFSNAAMGYDKQDVKFYLEALAAYRYSLEHADEIEQNRLANLAKIDLNNPNFKTSFRGYKISEIDDFIRQNHSPEEIYQAKFSKQFGGYNIYQVDFYLDAWIQKLKGNL